MHTVKPDASPSKLFENADCQVPADKGGSPRVVRRKEIDDSDSDDEPAAKTTTAPSAARPPPKKNRKNPAHCTHPGPEFPVQPPVLVLVVEVT